MQVNVLACPPVSLGSLISNCATLSGGFVIWKNVYCRPSWAHQTPLTCAQASCCSNFKGRWKKLPVACAGIACVSTSMCSTQQVTEWHSWKKQKTGFDLFCLVNMLHYTLSCIRNHTWLTFLFKLLRLQLQAHKLCPSLKLFATWSTK